jgi:hypothetical protein
MRPRSTEQGAARRRILLATAEAHPTHRPDVSVLFGRVLPEHGIDVDLVATTPQATALKAAAPWPGGQAYRRTCSPRARSHSRLGAPRFLLSAGTPGPTSW